MAVDYTQDPYQGRYFMIFAVSELNQIDFNYVLETSIDTVRKSVDELKTRHVFIFQQKQHDLKQTMKQETKKVSKVN